jgi:MFS family permease
VTRPLFTPGFTALLVAQASFGFAFSTFFLLPKFLVTELDQGPAVVGRVMSAFFVTSVVLSPLMGAVVDRRGRRRFLTAGALIQAASALAFLGVHEMGPAVYALRVLQGLAFSMAFVAGSAMAVDEAPPDRLALALGIFGLTFLANNALGPTAVELVAARFGWPHVFAMSAAAALLCAALSLRLREAPRPAADADIPRLFDVVRRPRLLRIGLVIGLSGMTFGAMFTIHQPFALALGIGPLRTFFVAYTLAAVAARVLLGPFTDRLDRSRVAMAALTVYGGAAFAMSELPRIGLAPIGAAFGLAHGVFYPTYNAVALEGAGPHERGKLMALFNAAFNVGVSTGTFLLGLLAEARGYPPVFVTAGIVAWIALAILASRRLDRPAGDTRTGATPTP